MTKAARRIPTFDAIEGRVLLSAGSGHRPEFAHRTAMVHRADLAQRAEAQVTHILLNGTVQGIPYGNAGQGGIQVLSFPMKGKVQTLGHVSASLALNDALIGPGRQPDLGYATLTLSNARGGVQIKMAASPSNRYIFIVTGGTGPYASAYGSGIVAIRYNSQLHEYQIALRSAKH